ncbi:unnamed protein product, partial [Brassica rapa]
MFDKWFMNLYIGLQWMWVETKIICIGYGVGCAKLGNENHDASLNMSAFWDGRQRFDSDASRVCSESSTLIIAIKKEAQNKEFIGIVSGIQQISYVFKTICFNFIPRAMNMQVDGLTKTALRDFPFI